MNKREMERRARIEGVTELLNNTTEPEDKIIKVIMAKYFVSRRMAKEYFDTAKTYLEITK